MKNVFSYQYIETLMISDLYQEKAKDIFLIFFDISLCTVYTTQMTNKYKYLTLISLVPALIVDFFYL